MSLLRPFYLMIFVISLLCSDFAIAQTTATIGTGSSSSSTRGPFQRSDTNSSTVFSRFVHYYSASEMSTAGIPSGASITQLNWELASSNTIIGAGDANLKIYIKNSTATQANDDTWANQIGGATLVLDEDFNTGNNFPGSNGWMPFALTTPFTYTGGAIEISVDWDCSQVTSPAFSGDGAIKWRWQSTAPDTTVVKKTSSSSPSSNITDLKVERANIQIVYNAVSCDLPYALNAMATADSAYLNWGGSTNASTYDWIIVAAGAGPMGTPVASGTTVDTVDTATSLTPYTSYDLYVESDCGTIGTSGFAGPFSFLTLPLAQSDVTIGMGSSSSSTRGPFQRSDTNSSTVFSRFVHVYTSTELAAAGIVNGAELTSLSWELASSNVMIGAGDANLKVYARNSTATMAVDDTWANLITGASLVVDNDYNTVNNFPGANGWMAFNFNAPFTYTGGSIEIAVDWDCSQVSTPAFDGDGSLKWRWESTAPDTLVVKKTSSSGPSTNIDDLKDERANIQFTYAITTCDLPTGLIANNVTQTSADFTWSSVLGTVSYDWKIVAAGAGSAATAVDDGNTSDTTATSSALAAGTSYDLYVEGDCGGIGSSGFAGPYNFTTLCANVPNTTISSTVTNVSCNGGMDGEIDLSVTSGIAPYDFAWSNADTTEDISSLAAGNYMLTVTDGNGCPYFDSVLVTEPDAITSTSTRTNVTCNGDSDGDIDVTVTGGTSPYTYVWTNAATTEDLTSVTAGTYTLTVTDDNGCTYAENFAIDEPSELSLSGSSIADTNNAGLGSATVTASGGIPPYSYDWDGVSGTETLTGLTEGSYLATVTDSNGCTDTISVRVDNLVGIGSIAGLAQLSVAPNPTNGQTAINLELPESAMVGISIFSIRGELLETAVQDNTQEVKQILDLSTYEDGLYFVRISINDESITKKIILIK